MDTATRHELRLLRLRAYGPDADIQQDPHALGRLHELEALERGTAADSSDGSAAATPVDTPSEQEPLAQTEAEDSPEPQLPPGVIAEEPATAASESAARSKRSSSRLSSLLSRGLPLAWALSLVATAAVAAAVTYGVTSLAPVAVSSGAPQIATLDPAPGVEVPSGWLGAGPSSVTWEFYGLTLFETAGGFMGTGSDCFGAVATEEVPEEDADQGSYSFSGSMYSGCSVGAFPASIEMAADSNAPEELRSRFPDAFLQFVRDGDRIGVFLDGD